GKISTPNVGRASIRALELKPFAAIEVPDDGRLFHKGVVNSLMGDRRRFRPAVPFVMFEYEIFADRGDCPGITQCSASVYVLLESFVLCGGDLREELPRIRAENQYG